MLQCRNWKNRQEAPSRCGATMLRIMPRQALAHALPPLNSGVRSFQGMK
jgi:hypothetical protein